jgi:hypothetical protein
MQRSLISIYIIGVALVGASLFAAEGRTRIFEGFLGVAMVVSVALVNQILKIRGQRGETYTTSDWLKRKPRANRASSWLALVLALCWSSQLILWGPPYSALRHYMFGFMALLYFIMIGLGLREKPTLR